MTRDERPARRFADMPRQKRSLPRSLLAGGQRRRRVLSRARCSTPPAKNRRRSAQGNSRPARLSAQRRPRLSDARPHGPHALRRRIAAHPPRRARSAAGWSACSTSSTSRRSACIRATTTACSTRCTQLRDMGNTVVVVEHDEDTMRAADHLIDFGPGPGVRGGEVVGQRHRRRSRRRPAQPHRPSILSGRRARSTIPEKTRPLGNGNMAAGSSAPRTTTSRTSTSRFRSARSSASPASAARGKSSLVNDILVEALHRDLNGGEGTPGARTNDRRARASRQADRHRPVADRPHAALESRRRTSSSSTTSATCTRSCPRRRRRGYKPGRFSFNVPGGRCEACEGNGSNRLEMDFLADVWVTCPVCEGQRFNRETLQVQLQGQEHRRRAGDGRAAGARALREHPQDPPQAADAARRRPRLPQARPAVAHALRRRSPAHQAGPRAGEDAAPARRCTCSTSRRPACTSTTSSCC